MTTTTNTRTEYAVLALKPDGDWKVLFKALSVKEAKRLHKGYLSCVESWPHAYTRYAAYRIAKRTVITTVEDWQEVQP